MLRATEGELAASRLPARGKSVYVYISVSMHVKGHRHTLYMPARPANSI